MRVMKRYSHTSHAMRGKRIQGGPVGDREELGARLGMNVNNTPWWHWPRSTPCGGVDYIMPIMWTVQENGLVKS